MKLIFLTLILISTNTYASQMRNLGPLKDSNRDYFNGSTLSVVNTTKLPKGPSRESKYFGGQAVCGPQITARTQNLGFVQCQVCAQFDVKYPIADYPGLEKGDQLLIYSHGMGGDNGKDREHLVTKVDRTGDIVAITCLFDYSGENLKAADVLQILKGTLE